MACHVATRQRQRRGGDNVNDMSTARGRAGRGQEHVYLATCFARSLRPKLAVRVLYVWDEELGLCETYACSTTFIQSLVWLVG